MTQYTIIAEDPQRHYIKVEIQFPVMGQFSINLQLPSWRPGRYELANYAQNIRDFQVLDGKGQPVKYGKVTKDLWELMTENIDKVTVKYEYYACQLDAGASYFDEKQLYINPVGCLMYIPERIDLPCSLSLKGLPDNYEVASSLHFDAYRKAEANDYHTLADSPFIASPTLLHDEYKVDEYVFHLWIQGNTVPDWVIIKDHFEKFTRTQIELYGEFPVKEYHFLFHMLNVPFHHGVEHLANTVIALGPGYKLMHSELYVDFLGISSHELFHSWNIKSIRPAEMLPYDYTEENYSKLGYVCEGVTTYYGDYMLLRSQCYNWHEYAIEVESNLKRHFHTFGRLHQTLADSSFDSWLDGYKPGAPDRKISFYVKGMLVALIQDIFIRKDTDNKYCLDNVMRELYYQFAKKNIGYTEEDYLQIICRLSGKDYRDFFNKYIWGLEPIEEVLTDALDYIGCRLKTDPAKIICERLYGLKLKDEPHGGQIITQTAPGSPAWNAGFSIGDEIIAINGMRADKNINELFMHFAAEPVIINFFRNQILHEITMTGSKEGFFTDYTIHKLDTASDKQKENYQKWANTPW